MAADVTAPEARSTPCTDPSAIFPPSTEPPASWAFPTAPGASIPEAIPWAATSRVTVPDVPPPASPDPAVTPVMLPPGRFSASKASLNDISSVEGSCEPFAASDPKATTRPVPATTSTVSRTVSAETEGNSEASDFWICSHWRTAYVFAPSAAPVPSLTVTATSQVPVPVTSTNPKLKRNTEADAGCVCHPPAISVLSPRPMANDDGTAAKNCPTESASASPSCE